MESSSNPEGLRVRHTLSVTMTIYSTISNYCHHGIHLSVCTQSMSLAPYHMGHMLTYDLLENIYLLYYYL